MNWSELDSRIVALAAAALLLAVWAVASSRRRKPDESDEAERRRRVHLNKVGRIVEGQILEITEVPAAPPRAARRWRLFSPKQAPAAGNGARTLVHYLYSISGVSYETAQDVTGLNVRACLDRLIAGQPISVKYDPANPGNSILLADDWSGLH